MLRSILNAYQPGNDQAENKEMEFNDATKDKDEFPKANAFNIISCWAAIIRAAGILPQFVNAV
ncbi:hypothetical protein [Echinicola rosea]|uniref:hypothetical protein n=1 Tax=Echinicola rosea TaxID=1807691 RepID=UPI0016510367|nr:hypothetical protein [Echinicola rosea]